ncbi:MAG TPA: 5-oxoprolinase subunit PxpB [Vicinamibacterales bacterium]|nr:5-oxoprolinase subunit PxpB [Vicinamibacterales bacterium]
MTAPSLVAAGDSAALLRLGDTIDPAINARALRIAALVRERGPAGVRDVVVGYASVTVFFDPLQAERGEVEQILRRAEREAGGDTRVTPRRVTIPVTYGGDAGPDLPEVARFANLSEDAAVALHAGREYRVFMLGFLPGFPYMGLVDERIAMPRRDAPRLVVPAGSVGVAGRQTGVYPLKSPGGWRLIGRTDTVMFDASRETPAFLQAGDLVRFVRS